MQDQQTTIALLGSTSGPPSEDCPRIYVACLAAYNAGILHGAWINADDSGEVQNAVQKMLAASPVDDAEEWAIHDYDGFEGADLSEWSGFDHVCALAIFINEHGKLGAELFQHMGQDLGEACAAFEDYAGEYASLGDFAAELTEQTGEAVPDHLRSYIDWDAMGRDMELSGDVFTIEMGFERVHIFWAR